MKSTLFGLAFIATLCTPTFGEAASNEVVLHSFKLVRDGRVPFAPLLSGPAGSFFGTTTADGSWQGGTIFKISPPPSGQTVWPLEILYQFQGGADGGELQGGLIERPNGHLYGVATKGGEHGQGVVYELIPPIDPATKWTQKVLYSFKGGTDGSGPDGELVVGPGGALYGVTSSGGIGSCNTFTCGTVYKLAPPTPSNPSWTETILYRFKGKADGGGPTGPLLVRPGGVLYGTTVVGGGTGCTNGCGTVFSLKASSAGVAPWIKTTLYRFKGGTDGNYPRGGLIAGGSGNLYGTADSVVFELDRGPDAWVKKTIFKANNTSTLPSSFWAPLTISKNGTLYGTSLTGGTYNSGTVFKLTKVASGWNMSVVHSFGRGLDGILPMAGIIFDAAGFAYGTTNYGGSFGVGTVYRLKP